MDAFWSDDKYWTSNRSGEEVLWEGFGWLGDNMWKEEEHLGLDLGFDPSLWMTTTTTTTTKWEGGFDCFQDLGDLFGSDPLVAV
ncbi:hypothetical protein MLD38_018510 [Melastoma candidum]|nr:hypothetical protein MLD38_018510 [Melastoma candidum]